jgi:hypothetical protein
MPTMSPVTEIRYAQTGCLGRCPIYEVVYRRDNCAIFNGVALVALMGRYTSKVDFAKLLAKIEILRFDTLAPAYHPSRVLDVPHYLITVVRGSTQRTIDLTDLTVPAELTALLVVRDVLQAQTYTTLWYRGEDKTIAGFVDGMKVAPRSAPPGCS